MNLAAMPSLGNGSASNSFANNIGDGTKDVELQKSDLDSANVEAQVQTIANQYQMKADAARQLVTLANQFQAATAQGSMTAEDREAIVNGAMAVAGISADEVNAAVTKKAQNNDDSGIADLMNKAATNLGMPSSAGLRDQLLPALGIQI